MSHSYFDKYITSGESFPFAFAPGRIEFLGNHLDYNGGNVLGVAIDAGIYCLGMPKTEPTIGLESEGFDDSKLLCSLNSIEIQKENLSWTNYPLGVLQELKNRKLAPTQGFHLAFSSNLPTSVGLSSSAALELATALVLLELSNKRLPLNEVVRLCRYAENNFVGVPCGILDQGTSAFGKANHLVKIDCKEEKFDCLPLPKASQTWIFDTGIKHDLVDSLYSERYNECQKAFEIIQQFNPSVTTLASCNLKELDPLASEESLRKRAIHVIEEQTRVESLIGGLNRGESPESLGKLLYQSHLSSSKNFENSCQELDFLAETLNHHPRVFGARLTGGGFGGAVMAWTNQDFHDADAIYIQELYYQRFSSSLSWHQFSPSDGARLTPCPVSPSNN